MCSSPLIRGELYRLPIWCWTTAVTGSLKRRNKRFSVLSRLKSPLHGWSERGSYKGMHHRLTHGVELTHTPNERFTHLKQKDRWLDHAATNYRVDEGLKLCIVSYFHAVTVVEKGKYEKDLYRAAGDLN